MKVLVVAQAYGLSDMPYDGFVIRHVDIVRHLAESHDVQLLLLRRPEDMAAVTSTLGDLERDEVAVPRLSNTRAGRLWRALSSLRWKPTKKWEIAMVEAIRRAAPDVALTLGPWLSDELRPVHLLVPSLYLMEEDLTRMEEISSQTLQGRIFRAFERVFTSRGRGQARLVGVIAEPELSLARRMYRSAQVAVVAYSLPDPEWLPALAPSRGQRVLVAGVLLQERNVEGLVAILNEVKSRGLTDHIQFDLVSGAGLHQAVRDFVGGDFVRHKEVDGSIRPIYEAAAVVLVPATRVTGLKTTVLQAWACGCPVVCFEASANSVGEIDESALLVARTPEEAVDKLVHLLADRELAVALSVEGLRRVKDRYHPGSQGASVTCALERVADSSRD